MTNSNSNKKTILIVDDEAMNLKIISSLLKDKYNIKISNNGKNAIKIAQRDKIDLLLLDIMMPEMDGFQVAEILKSDEKTKSIPIIFITAKQDKEAIVKGFKIGAIDFVSKPFSNEELSIRIKTHLDFYSMQRKLNETLLKTERQLKIIDQYVIYSQTDLNGVITAVSDAFCDFSGFKREELIGKNHNIVKSGETAVDVFQNLWGVISEDKTWEGEFINQKKQGKIYYTAVKISPEFNQNGDKIGYIGFFQDITDKIIIKKLAETDHLTKLYNRQKVDRCLDSEYENSLNSQKELSLMMLDIDHFKAVNDTYGHQIGDNVLVDISNILQNNTRKDDIVGRFGGEEFIIILPNTNVEEAKEIAEKLRKIIENNEFPTVGQKTISIGVSSYKDNLSLNDLIKNADEALYKAKNNGRNRVEII